MLGVKIGPQIQLGGICCPVSVTWIFAPFGNSRFEVGRTTLKLLHLPDSIWNSLDSNAIYISNYCTARIFCPVCKLQGTGNIEIASYSVSVQTLRFYHAFRDWNTVVGSNCCPFQLPKRGPVPQTSCFRCQNGASFQLPKRGPVPVTETGPRSPNLPFQLPVLICFLVCKVSLKMKEVTLIYSFLLTCPQFL